MLLFGFCNFNSGNLPTAAVKLNRAGFYFCEASCVPNKKKKLICFCTLAKISHLGIQSVGSATNNE